MNKTTDLTVSRQQTLESLKQYGQVIYALVMHDIKTRFFGNGLGQIVMILWPFIHILVLLLIFNATGRVVPYGQSPVLYCATGVIPFIIFAYMSRWIAYAVVQNRSYTQYPIVKTLDLMMGRAILEFVSSIVVILCTILVLSAIGVDCWPKDIVQAAYALGASFLLAFGLGILNGAITSIFPLWLTLYSISIIVAYASSGILFVASNLPENIRYIISYNPVLQTVEWMRSAYYVDYSQLVLDRTYTICLGLGTLGFGLIVQRCIRQVKD